MGGGGDDKQQKTLNVPSDGTTSVGSGGGGGKPKCAFVSITGQDAGFSPDVALVVSDSTSGEVRAHCGYEICTKKWKDSSKAVSTNAARMFASWVPCYNEMMKEASKHNMGANYCDVVLHITFTEPFHIDTVLEKFRA
eukprot:scaffold252000_cov66-Attheya_sp.AAC.1